MPLLEKQGRRLLHCALLFCLMMANATGHAAAQLMGEVELIEALKSQPPCCVIDARSDSTRKQQPLDDALVFRADLSIIPTASVIIVGDDNAKALVIANLLNEKHPGKEIYAVRGGIAAWTFVRRALDKTSHTSGAAPAGISFVIPHNTCETGAPLQILNSNRPKR